jgi:hypothetical protein
MAAGTNVRGALVGRNVLYPGADDPLAIAEAAGGIVHRGWSVEEATRSMATTPVRDLDHFHALCKGGTT